ncbi:MAG: hypothetical protein Q9157_004781 [Trypethelium eluteriae]
MLNMRISLPCLSKKAGKRNDQTLPSSENLPVLAKPVATEDKVLIKSKSGQTNGAIRGQQDKPLKVTTSESAAPAVNSTRDIVHKSSVLWKRAMERIKETEDWKKYCVVVRKQHLTLSSAVSEDEPQQDSKDTSKDNVEEMILSSSADVLNTMTAVKDQVQNSEWSFQLGERRIIVRNVYNEVIDVFAAIKDPGTSLARLNPYASIGWSSLQYVVQRLQTAREVRDMCWEVLPRATFLISRYQTMNELYTSNEDVHKSSDMLEQALTELYEQIMSYQITMIIYLNDRMERFRASFSDASNSKLSKIWEEIKDKEASLSGLQSLADREINNEKFVRLLKASEELNNNLNKTWDEVQGISRIVEGQQRRKILNWISEMKYEDAHNQKRRTAAAKYATGNWLLAQPHYRAWLLVADPPNFWLHGFMGSGKTCLTHLAIEDIKNNIEHKHGQHLAYYYIDGAEARGDQDCTRKILRCLLKQLAGLGSGERMMEAVLNSYETHAEKGSLTEGQTMGLFQTILNDNYSTFLILDGLDECDRGTFNQLMNCIDRLCDGARGRVQVFFSSRQEQFIEDRMKALGPREIDVKEYNKKDIQKYISTRLKHSIDDWPELYRRGSEDQSRDIRDTLQKNAQGMFRWIDVAFGHLHSGQNFSDMQERLKGLNHLPNLFDLYDKIYETAMKTLGSRSRDALRLALTLMLYSDLRSVYRHWGRFEDFQYLLERRGNEYEPRRGYCYLAKESLKVFIENECYARAQRAANGLFVYYASIGWTIHLHRVCAAGPGIQWETIIKDGGLLNAIDAFLLRSRVPEAFIRWQSYVRANQKTLSRFFSLSDVLAQPPSTLFARLMFHLPYKDPNFSLAHLEAEERIDQPGFSAVHLASMMHNMAAVEWLAKTMETLLKCKAEPHLPQGFGSLAPYTPQTWPGQSLIIPGTETFSDLEVALGMKCSTDAAIVLFLDGYSKVEAPQEWYIWALWTAVKEVNDPMEFSQEIDCLFGEDKTKGAEDFNQWLLQRYNDYVPKNVSICGIGGLPACRYITEDSWAYAGVALREEFVAQVATCVGEKFEDMKEQWQLSPRKIHLDFNPFDSDFFSPDGMPESSSLPVWNRVDSTPRIGTFDFHASGSASGSDDESDFP